MNYKKYEIEVLKLFEDFSQTKEHSEEVMKATSAMGEIDRKKRQQIMDEFWKNLQLEWESVERVGTNVKEGVTNFAQGTSDIVTDTVGHLVDKSIWTIVKLLSFGASGIGLMILFYCAVPLLRLYISRNTPAAAVGNAGVLRIPRQMWNEVHDRNQQQQQPQGGKSQKKKRKTKRNKKSKTHKRNKKSKIYKKK